MPFSQIQQAKVKDNLGKVLIRYTQATIPLYIWSMKEIWKRMDTEGEIHENGHWRDQNRSKEPGLIHFSFWKCHHQCYLCSLYDYDNVKKIRIKGQKLELLIRRRPKICQTIPPLRREVVEVFRRLSISSDNH